MENKLLDNLPQLFDSIDEDTYFQEFDTGDLHKDLLSAREFAEGIRAQVSELNLVVEQRNARVIMKVVDTSLILDDEQVEASIS